MSDQAAIDRGTDFRATLASASAPIICPPGDYDFGSDPLLVSVPVKGAGRYHTHWYSQAMCSTHDRPTVACCFELADGAVLEGMTLESNCPPVFNQQINAFVDQQTLCVGFAPFGTVAGKSRSATIRDCRILAKAWGVYLWAENDCKLLLEDDEIRFGKQGLSACNSNGQTIDGRRLRFYGEPWRSFYYGAVTNKNYGGVLAIAVRSGKVRLWDCYVELNGPPPDPNAPGIGRRCVGLTDWYDSDWVGGNRGFIELHNFDCRILDQVASSQFDLDIRKMPLIWTGGTGTGPAMGYSTNVVAPGTINKTTNGQ